MLISVINVYQEGNNIKIGFTNLKVPTMSSRQSDLDREDKQSMRWRDPKNILGFIEKNFTYQETRSPKESFNRLEGSSTDFFTIAEDMAIICTINTSVYQLPVDPVLTLDFLEAFDTYTASREFDFILFANEPILEKLQKLDAPGLDDGIRRLFLRTDNVSANRFMPGTFEEYIKAGRRETNRDSIVKAFAEYILASQINSIPALVQTRDAINKIYEHCAKHPDKKFTDCLRIMNRLGILLDIPNNMSVENTEAALTERGKYLNAIEEKLLHENRQDDLDHFIQNLAKDATRKLYEPCIGKKAPDENWYSWSYTEWDLLSNADFQLRSDNRMSFKVENNSGYLSHYAVGRRNHLIIAYEMRNLGAIIGLEFDSDTDFHKEIIFTPACTMKLIAAGVDLDPSRLEKLLSLRQVPNKVSFRKFFWEKVEPNSEKPVVAENVSASPSLTPTLG